MTDKTAEKKAEAIIGDAAWEVLTNAASSSQIKAHQMRDVVWDLPTDQKKRKVGGEHDRRMKEKGTSADETEMRNILADWCYYGDMPDNRAEALEVLIKLFEKHGNKPLALDLKKIKKNEEQVQCYFL